MEKLIDTGKVKSIGISNFGPKLVERLLKHAKVVPVTNQVELHPCLPWDNLKSLCDSNGILLTAYSPLGKNISQDLVHELTFALRSTNCRKGQCTVLSPNNYPHRGST